MYRVAMDIIGLTGLGVELEELAPNPQYGFHALYETVLHGGATSHLMTMLNVYVPLRKILPLEANRKFLRAKEGMNSMLGDIVRQRIADMSEGKSNPAAASRRDLLSLMLEESMKAAEKTGKPLWSEDELISNVSRLVHWSHAKC